MADVAQYRFLPWTRRGLGAVQRNLDTGAALPIRPVVNVGVTITGAGAKDLDLAL